MKNYKALLKSRIQPQILSATDNILKYDELKQKPTVYMTGTTKLNPNLFIVETSFLAIKLNIYN